MLSPGGLLLRIEYLNQRFYDVKVYILVGFQCVTNECKNYK